MVSDPVIEGIGAARPLNKLVIPDFRAKVEATSRGRQGNGKNLRITPTLARDDGAMMGVYSSELFLLN